MPRTKPTPEARQLDRLIRSVSERLGVPLTLEELAGFAEDIQADRQSEHPDPEAVADRFVRRVRRARARQAGTGGE